ncbi:MAG: nucleotidyltransferase domain-containing protein [Defluviitaleaceae bacterium]|nr:nucleotidyltransferase domain-containing protein [Defluviitaleaceae bacterium]
MTDTRITNPRLNAVTQKVFNAAKETLGERLSKVILFGSYARGDFDSESDVDIFVLADVPHEEANLWSNSIDERLSDLWLDYDLLVCIHLTSKLMFERYYNVMPYYQNVVREGVELFG